MDSEGRLAMALTDLSRIVSANDVRVERRIIQHVSIEHADLGRMTLRGLRDDDAERLLDFYVEGLSARSRAFFPPYPLFSPAPADPQELRDIIVRWRGEQNWTVLVLWRKETLIGLCLLKRYDTERPTSGLAVREDYRRKGLGRLLQIVINEQARLLRLDTVYATIAPDNADSQAVHLRSGFKKTGRTMPHYACVDGRKIVDRQDVEMILEIVHE